MPGESVEITDDITVGSLTIHEGGYFYCNGGIMTITDGIYNGDGKKVIDVGSSLKISSSIHIYPMTGIFNDPRDGQEYSWVRIGTQVWMAENLKSTKYNDGTSIPNVTDYTAWAELTSGAYCWQHNDISNKEVYGALYNWFAVNTSKLCPIGWHVPDNTEWEILATFLGGASFAGAKMKETGLDHWVSPNTGATNSSGFTALPGGWRAHDNGTFHYLGRSFTYYASNERDATTAYAGYILSESISIVLTYSDKKRGRSVRCIKD